MRLISSSFFLNCHLTVVEQVWVSTVCCQRFNALAESPKASRSTLTGQTGSGSEAPEEAQYNKAVYIVLTGLTGGPTFEPQLWIDFIFIFICMHQHIMSSLWNTCCLSHYIA